MQNMSNIVLYNKELEAHIWQILHSVCDPEIPVLSITDLGIVREIKVENNSIEIVITPTYTGCPAMDMIAMNIKLALLENNIANFKITTTLSPAWTTDWMTDEGKIKLEKYGIAPPKKSIALDAAIKCPQCNSTNTFLISQFGSTACKALYKCNHCLEPFDYFKCY